MKKKEKPPAGPRLPRKLDVADHLLLQNVNLRMEVLAAEKRAIADALIAKYIPGAAAFTVTEDGTIVEAPKP